MNDRISEIEEQAKVILEWCRQQKELPEEKRDILEFRKRQLGSSQDWMVTTSATPTDLNLYDWRLRKRPKKHKVTVYWLQDTDGSVFPSFRKEVCGLALIGTSTVEFKEPQQ